MRALVSLAPGNWRSLRIAELPSARPGPGEVLVRIAAASINYPDALIIEDRYQYRPPRPFAPGGEVSGVVAEVGAGAKRIKPGMRVLALTVFGGLAEEVVVP